MAEPVRRGEGDLEQALRDLGSAVLFPPAPDLTGRVRARLTTRSARRPWWPVLRRAALTGAALVLLAVGLLLISPEGREAVADRLGLRGLRIEFTPEERPGVSEAGNSLDLGEAVTLDEARERSGLPVLLPSLPELGAPDGVYWHGGTPGGRVTLVYLARAGLPEVGERGVGLLLTQVQGGVEPVLIKKVAGAGTSVEVVDVAGSAGYWLSGAPHTVMFRDARGEVRQEAARLAGNTLLWERDGRLFRLESGLDKDAAVRIAESLR